MKGLQDSKPEAHLVLPFLLLGKEPAPGCHNALHLPKLILWNADFVPYFLHTMERFAIKQSGDVKFCRIFTTTV